MTQSTTLILDLDDTIFETKTITMDQVALIFEHFRSVTKNDYSPTEIEKIITDLWKVPFDVVSEKYQFTPEVNAKFSKAVEIQEYQFDIKPFQDFEHIQKLLVPKVLVTTGFRKLQLAKIEALGIESVFEQIHIDEVDSPTRIYKRGLFENLIEFNSNSEKYYVIGDNPESELKAGKELGLTTIQVSKFGQEKSQYSDYFISDYKELGSIIN